MINILYVFLAITGLDILLVIIYALYKNHKKEKRDDNHSQHDPGKLAYSNYSLYTIATAIYIGATTVMSLALFSVIHDKVTANIRPFSAPWYPKDSIKLKSGPEWFYYDQKAATVNSLHSITEKDKAILTELINKDSKDLSTYSQAIDQLAYTSNRDLGNAYYCWIILLYCMTGVIGVQLRTINNFVGIACYRKEFDFGIWWPWYSMRPLVGFITGGVVFLLIDGKLIYSSQVLNGFSPVVVALAFVGGFSADDFYIMLRRISQRVFSSAQAQPALSVETKKDDSKKNGKTT